jgi:FeS assembly protein IscX
MLGWESTYEIVLKLIETYPEAGPDSMGLQQLYELIIALPEFEDDPLLVNDGILNEILREWYEEINTL